MRTGLTSYWIASFALVAPFTAHAQLLRCASHQILAADAQRVFHAARSAVRPSPVIPSTLRVCMNPGFGRAWLDTEPEPRPDGSIIEHELSCTRETQTWSCEVSTSRVATLAVATPDGSKPWKFRLPMDMDLERANRLVTGAVTLGPTLKPEQACYPSPGAAAEGEFGSSEAFASIDGLDSGSFNVTIGGLVMTFDPIDGADEWRFRCWDIEIIVT